MNALDLHHTIFTSEKASDLPLRSASSFLHPAPERDESPTSQLFTSTAYQDLIQRQPTHPSGPMTGWDLGLNLLGDPITAEEYKNLKDHQTKMKLRRLHAANIAFELLFVIWGTYITIRYFLAFADGASESGRVCALALGIMSTLVVALVTISLMMPLFPQGGRVNAWRRTRSLLRACYLLLLCAGPVVNLVLVIMWRPGEHCHWDIDISWYTSGISTCHPVPFGAWIAAATVRLAVTWTIVLLFIFTLRLYSETRHPSERSSPHYTPYFSSDTEDISPVSPSSPRNRLKSKFTRSDDSGHMHMPNRSNTTLPKYTSISTLAPSTSCTGHSRSHATPPLNDRKTSSASMHMTHHGSSDTTAQTQSVNVTDGASMPHMLRHKSRVSLRTLSASSHPETGRDSSPSETRSSASSRPGARADNPRKTSTAWETGHTSQTSASTSCSSHSLDGDEHAYGYGAAVPAYPYLELYNPVHEDGPGEALSEGGGSSGEEEYVAMMGGYVQRLATIESLGSREAVSASASMRVAETSSSLGAVVGGVSREGSRSTAYLSFSSASGVHVNERGELVSARSTASSPYDRLYYTATSGGSFPTDG